MSCASFTNHPMTPLPSIFLQKACAVSNRQLVRDELCSTYKVKVVSKKPSKDPRELLHITGTRPDNADRMC
jgi:hypothetical protein